MNKMKITFLIGLMCLEMQENSVLCKKDDEPMRNKLETPTDSGNDRSTMEEIINDTIEGGYGANDFEKP